MQEINYADRVVLNGHPAKVIWFTGLSGAGKSTLACALEPILYGYKFRTYVLDGDHLRRGLSHDLGFADAHRSENVRRAGELCRLMFDAGLIVIVALISPFEKDRLLVREMFAIGDFIEIFCDAPLAVCEGRDTKGLYRKVRAGKIQNFTGISSDYQPPKHPELVLDTKQLSVTECTDRIMEFLRCRKLL